MLKSHKRLKNQFKYTEGKFCENLKTNLFTKCPLKKSIRLKIPDLRIISTATKAKPQPRYAVPPQQSFSKSSNHL